VTLHLLLLSILVYSSIATVPNAQLDGTDANAYLEMAEDYSQETADRHSIENARRCYVLAAFIDPTLKRSAILGLIELEDSAARRDQLLASLPPSGLLLGSVASRVEWLRPVASPASIFEACRQVQALRLQDTIVVNKRSDTQLELLRFASEVLPKNVQQILLQGGKVPVEKSLTKTSLQAELLLLGGTTQWSTAVLINGDVPLGIGGHIDLAALMGVDISLYLFEDGKWVAP